MKPLCALLAIAVSASPALAVDDEHRAVELAELAGAIIGSQSACSIDLDQDKLNAWFESRVPPAFGGAFARVMDIEVWDQKRRLEEMGDSQRTLHCRAIYAKAEHEGWEPSECQGWNCL